MLDAKLEEWIKDFEARFDDIDHLEKRAYKPTKFIYDLRHKSTYLQVENLETESGTEEIIYCYIPSNRQGLVLKRENSQIGSMASYVNYVSYGNISLGDFTNSILHSPLRTNQELEDMLSLISWLPSFQ